MNLGRGLPGQADDTPRANPAHQRAWPSPPRAKWRREAFLAQGRLATHSNPPPRRRTRANSPTPLLLSTRRSSQFPKICRGHSRRKDIIRPPPITRASPARNRLNPLGWLPPIHGVHRPPRPSWTQRHSFAGPLGFGNVHALNSGAGSQRKCGAVASTTVPKRTASEPAAGLGLAARAAIGGAAGGAPSPKIGSSDC